MRTILFGAVLCCFALVVSAQNQPIVVKFEETDEILANPGMGWQTFHRPAKRDKNLPEWIPSTVQYVRWGWHNLEPTPGKLNAELLDETLAEAKGSGQKLAFRVMCCSTTKNEPYHPKWLIQMGGREIVADYEGEGPLPIPDLDDPIVLGKHLDFIKRLGAAYDGHPDLDHVDLGSIGWWGEWHLSGSKKVKLPAIENRRKIVEAYLAAFKKTPLIMLIGGGECLKQAVAGGAGWRADCLGDLGGFSKTWCHMRKGYPVWIREAGLENAWKTAPVAFESCWDMRKWVKEGWPLRFIFNYALACHATYLNNKSAPLPEGENIRPELERFLRRLGYRLVLRELAHPAQAKAGEALALSMKWQNTGSAPCYRPYRVAYRVAAADGSGRPVIFTSEVTVNRWLPGTIPLFTEEFFKQPNDLPPGELADVADSIKLPADLAAGTYVLSVGIVDKAGGPPVVRLAINGRDNEGWYPVGRIEVKK